MPRKEDRIPGKGEKQIVDTFKLASDVDEETIDLLIESLGSGTGVEEELLRHLVRANARLALIILAEAHKRQDNPEDAFTSGALFMLGSLAAEDQASVDQVFTELARSLEADGVGTEGPVAAT